MGFYFPIVASLGAQFNILLSKTPARPARPAAGKSWMQRRKEAGFPPFPQSFQQFQREKLVYAVENTPGLFAVCNISVNGVSAADGHALDLHQRVPGQRPHLEGGPGGEGGGA